MEFPLFLCSSSKILLTFRKISIFPKLDCDCFSRRNIFPRNQKFFIANYSQLCILFK